MVLKDSVENFENEPITFYPPKHYPLDNFSSFAVDLEDGLRYPTSEHAYQASKFFTTDPLIAEKIRNARSAHDAKKIAHEHEEKVRKDWDDIKLDVMKSVLLKKVHQNPYVKKILFKTGDRPIVEDSPTDSFWGWDSDKQGENHLGRLWMEIREDIRAELEGE